MKFANLLHLRRSSRHPWISSSPPKMDTNALERGILWRTRQWHHHRDRTPISAKRKRKKKRERDKSAAQCILWRLRREAYIHSLVWPWNGELAWIPWFCMQCRLLYEEALLTQQSAHLVHGFHQGRYNLLTGRRAGFRESLFRTVQGSFLFLLEYVYLATMLFQWPPQSYYLTPSTKQNKLWLAPSESILNSFISFRYDHDKSRSKLKPCSDWEYHQMQKKKKREEG